MTRRLGFVSIVLVMFACNRSNPDFNAGERCVAPASGATATVCTGGTACDPTVGVCVCPSPSALCGSVCADLTTDGANCGGCGLACPSGQSCAAGRCSGGGCPTGAIDCNGNCIDPLTNAQNCGGCASAGGGHNCGSGSACVMGACTKETCPFGATLCGATCVDLSSSAASCGACGHACGSGEVCSVGTCQSACAPGLTSCGSACVDLKHDPTNCGSCGTLCSTDQVCAQDNGTIKCRDYAFAGCNMCPCPSCGDRRCCNVPDPKGGYAVLCVEDQCPQP